MPRAAATPPVLPGTCGVERTLQGRTLVVVVSGEIDIASARALRSGMRMRGDDLDSLVVDLSGATFIDSTGMRTLVEAQNRAKVDDVHLVIITAPGSAVDRALELCALTHHLTIVHDRPDHPIHDNVV